MAEVKHNRSITVSMAGMVLTVVFLLLVNAALTVSLVLFFKGQIDAEHAQSIHQGAKIEHSICVTMASLAALQPPSGSAEDNPSRAYEQKLHATLAEIGPDLECNG